MKRWILWLAMAGTAAGQATVEAGLGAARAATSTAPAAGLGKSMAGLAGSLDKAMKGGQPDAKTVPVSASKASAAGSGAPAAETKPAAAAKWEDPSGIETGLSYAELVRRFGPPALEISGEDGRSLTYMSKAGAFRVAVSDDQVTGVRKPPA